MGKMHSFFVRTEDTGSVVGAVLPLSLAHPPNVCPLYSLDTAPCTRRLSKATRTS